MGRELDLYAITEDPTNLRDNLIALRNDFDQHIHDGTSSRTFQTLIAETVSARVLAIRKSSFTDNTAGMWAGLVGNQPKFFLGDSTNYFKFDQSGIAISVGTSGSLTISNNFAASAAMRMNSTGLIFLYSAVQNGAIYMTSMSTPYSGQAQMTIQIGDVISGGSNPGITVNIAATSGNTGHFSPGAGDTMDLGNSSEYWNEINYKTLTDRGCLGRWLNGVAMSDGSKASHLDALKAIKVHPNKKTIYDVPMLDYSTMPQSVYKPAPVAPANILYPKGHPKEGQIRFYKGEKMGEDGAETTALISIMIGAILELTDRVADLEQKAGVIPKKPF